MHCFIMKKSRCNFVHNVKGIFKLIYIFVRMTLKLGILVDR